MIDELIAYLRARIDEEEAVARAAGSAAWTWDKRFGDLCDDPTCPYGALMQWTDPGPTMVMEVHGYDVTEPWQGAEHIACWDPARVLAECAAKRAILDAEPSPGPMFHDDTWDGGRDLLDRVILAFAQVYADRPDFDPSWSA